MPFHRGDVFVNGQRTGIEEYSPDGTPVQLIAGTNSGGRGFCFDPAGNHLIVPGAGLFDKQGRMLESNWASVYNKGFNPDCVVDGFGDVFLESGPTTITKYDIEGNLLQSFTVAFGGGFGFAIALAPDDCTIYYGSWGGFGPVSGIERFNICTNTQDPTFTRDYWVDELRILPNWEVLTVEDSLAELHGVSGQFVRGYPGLIGQNYLRYMSLDPDGTSFWTCCDVEWPKGDPLFRFDINSGELLAQWSPIERGPIAVYSPDNNGRGAG
jgi:hypothetical protein